MEFLQEQYTDSEDEMQHAPPMVSSAGTCHAMSIENTGPVICTENTGPVISTENTGPVMSSENTGPAISTESYGNEDGGPMPSPAGLKCDPESVETTAAVDDHECAAIASDTAADNTSPPAALISVTPSPISCRTQARVGSSTQAPVGLSPKTLDSVPHSSGLSTMHYRDTEEETSGSDSDSSVEFSAALMTRMNSASSDEEDITSRRCPKKASGRMKTKGEIWPEDLPPIEDLQISVTDDLVLHPLGVVSAVVETLAIVQSNSNVPALNDDSILFLQGRRVMGQVFETFGPVSSPLYSVRFNSKCHLEDQGVAVGVPVSYAPHMSSYTRYIFLAELQKMKGSDASWEHNNEPPEKFVDYSDDEDERRAKMKRRGRAGDQEEEDDDSNGGGCIPNSKKGRTQKPREKMGRDQQTRTECTPHRPDNSQLSKPRFSHPPVNQWPPNRPPQPYTNNPPPRQPFNFNGNPRPPRHMFRCPPPNMPRWDTMGYSHFPPRARFHSGNCDPGQNNHVMNWGQNCRPNSILPQMDGGHQNEGINPFLAHNQLDGRPNGHMNEPINPFLSHKW